ncbi:MAG: preprotein translocase subunit SecE, partial [Cryobacterium sp.]|nr:preprotein translocase subunit SecE [Cryobacterium sp.]
KVITPTRRELISYTGVVLVFVVFMMAIVSLLDLLFGTGVGYIFGNGPTK